MVRENQRIREVVPDEATFIGVCTSSRCLKCHRVLVLGMPSSCNMVICRYSGFTFQTFVLQYEYDPIPPIPISVVQGCNEAVLTSTHNLCFEHK